MAHAFAFQILFIFTPNGPTHVLSTILKYFWPETKMFLRNDYFRLFLSLSTFDCGNLLSNDLLHLILFFPI